MIEHKSEKFQSDFRIVADYFVQMRESRDYIPNEEKLGHIQETLQLLGAMTGDHRFEEALGKGHNGQGGAQTMSEVLDRVEARGMDIGEKRGIAIGEERGIAIGEERGKAIGEETTTLSNIRSLMNNLKFDSKQAMDALNIPVSDREKYEAKL